MSDLKDLASIIGEDEAKRILDDTIEMTAALEASGIRFKTVKIDASATDEAALTVGGSDGDVKPEVGAKGGETSVASEASEEGGDSHEVPKKGGESPVDFVASEKGTNVPAAPEALEKGGETSVASEVSEESMAGPDKPEADAQMVAPHSESGTSSAAVPGAVVLDVEELWNTGLGDKVAGVVNGAMTAADVSPQIAALAQAAESLTKLVGALEVKVGVLAEQVERHDKAVAGARVIFTGEAQSRMRPTQQVSNASGEEASANGITADTVMNDNAAAIRYWQEKRKNQFA